MDDCLDSVDTKTKVICLSVTSAVILITTMIAVSFGTLEPTEYGIVYNSISKSVDTENIYEGGLQFIGLFNRFIAYPRIQKSIEFSDNVEAQSDALQTRT